MLKTPIRATFENKSPNNLNNFVIKKFEIPAYYRSSITGKIKESRRLKDLRKQDFSPAVLDLGPVQFILARHFGFCYGVENAIEISYRARSPKVRCVSYAKR